jgi:hypothetical protein
MAVCCESSDANKNVSKAQRSIRVAALTCGSHFFDPFVACCRGCNDSEWIVGTGNYPSDGLRPFQSTPSSDSCSNIADIVMESLHSLRWL